MKLKISFYDKLFSPKLIITSDTYIGRGSSKLFNYDIISRVKPDGGLAKISFRADQIYYEHLAQNPALIVHQNETYKTGEFLEYLKEIPLADKDVLKIGHLKYLIRIIK